MAHRRTSFARKSPSNKNWAGTSQELISVTSGSKVLLGVFQLSAEGIDETILRTVGQLTCRSTGNTGFFQGAFGMIQVSDTAVAEGIAAIPSPLFDIGDDGWFIFAPITSDEEAGGTDKLDGRSVDFDSKAKRIVHGGQATAMVFELSAGSNDIRLSLVIRMLAMVRGT